MSRTVAQPQSTNVALQSDCEAIEARTLANRIASGRHALDLIRGESDDAELIEKLALYVVDVETHSKAQREVIVAAMSMLQQQDRQIDRLREQLRAGRLEQPEAA